MKLANPFGFSVDPTHSVCPEPLRVTPSAATTTQDGLARRVVKNLAVVDWIATVYFAVLAACLLVTRGPNCWGSLKDVCMDYAVLVLAFVLVRGDVVRGAFASTVIRVGITAPIVLSYFQLRWIAPAITSRALDSQLYAFDLRVFHVEPSVAWDKYVSSGTTEWFAFFYFGYFVIVAGNCLPFLLGAE